MLPYHGWIEDGFKLSKGTRMKTDKLLAAQNAAAAGLAAILFKHVGEVPGIISKGHVFGTALVTKGAERIDPLCDFEMAFKPLEVDLIGGGFMAPKHGELTVAHWTAEYETAGFGGGLVQKLLDLLIAHPEMLSYVLLILKLFGINIPLPTP